MGIKTNRDDEFYPKIIIPPNNRGTIIIIMIKYIWTYIYIYKYIYIN